MSLIKINNGLDVNITKDNELKTIQKICSNYLEGLHPDDPKNEKVNAKLNLFLDILNLYQPSFPNSSTGHKNT